MIPFTLWFLFPHVPFHPTIPITSWSLSPHDPFRPMIPFTPWSLSTNDPIHPMTHFLSWSLSPINLFAPRSLSPHYPFHPTPAHSILSCYIIFSLTFWKVESVGSTGSGVMLQSLQIKQYIYRTQYVKVHVYKYGGYRIPKHFMILYCMPEKSWPSYVL